ncbi:MAG: Lipopolysaccharide-assembly, LptC-related [Bacteroidetes bacterium ADurb.Bin302]|nr:MAG: Lipopolysaccharide-assembly, LptC-related [Bacteroidetes bacterium ADurb.Bin302]
MKKILIKYLNTYITVAFLATVMFVFISCSSRVKSTEELSNSRDSIALIHAWDVSTVISDSGITRYRLETPEWLVFDKAEEPYWDFPHGIHLEKFDENLNVYANVDADTAIYYNHKEMWILSGNVKAMNLDGEKFESEKLFVEQRNDRIYTDRFVTITQKERIINGIGLESNQKLTKYTILEPQGIIPIEEAPDSVSTSENQ